jgi:hypothetical protein
MKKFSFAGPQMPEDYKVRGDIKIKGITLPALHEEYFTYCARYVGTEYIDNLTFQKNFIDGWKQMGKALPAELKNITFAELMPSLTIEKDKQTAEKEVKKAAEKAKTSAQKKAEKEAKDKLKEKLGFADCDGEKVAIPYAVEAPGILITRGKDPRIGQWKLRMPAGEITVNVVGDPEKSVELKAKGFNVVSKPDVHWAFKYDIKCTGKNALLLNKKSMFGATSSFAKERTAAKYDHTLDLLKSWKKMQDGVKAAATGNDEKRKQAALCAYLMQMTGMRVGADRDLTAKADTRGASTLRVKEVKITK